MELIIAERLSARQLIPQYGAKSQLEFVCMYVSVTLKEKGTNPLA